MKFYHYSDPSHGWIAVPRFVLQDLGIDEAISSCSYQDDTTERSIVYLEEDGDAMRFIRAYKDEHGVEPEIVDLEQDNYPSFIRNLKSYCA